MKVERKTVFTIAIFAALWFVLSYCVSKSFPTAIGSAVLVAGLAFGFMYLDRDNRLK